jgi:uncharacterized protein (TIGR02246 family)
MRDFSIAWGSGDAEGAASAYAEDVEWTNAFGDVSRGSEALERKFEQLFTDVDADASEGEETNYQPVSMRFVGSDVAIVHGVTTSRRGSGVDGSDERRVHLTFVMAKQGGEWRIVHQVIMDART